MTEALEILRQTDPLRITVSGDIGSGKSTFAKRLASDLGVERIYIGALMREEAARRGLTLDQFQQLLITDDTFDRQVDALQNDKSKMMTRGIFEGRTAWHFVHEPTVRLFFKVDPEIAAERLWNANDQTRDTYKSIEEIVAANEARKQAEEQRYHDYYGISAYDPKNFDLIIDTSKKSIDEVYSEAVEAIATRLKT
jgi:cytidylate kinase